MIEVRKSWWRKRWHVYQIGQPDTETWLASFRYESHAHIWVAQRF
jgi:hypothetical protein